ncbi:hypothetical protein [Cryptosporangium sp. NPDC048952]|uniref:hypothetical protein n=1 Tax=Cryptosporangium sp. NPDC048952 TaxID=3363961 RepID=UPI00372196A5
MAARTRVEPSRNRRWRWLAAITLTTGLATVLGVRALQHGRSPVLVVALTVAVAYVTWPLMCRPTTRPHWTVATSASGAGVMLVAYGAKFVVTSGWLWGDIVLGLIGLTIVGIASVAWGIVGTLWLRHRARLELAPTPLPTAAAAVAALPTVAALPAPIRPALTAGARPAALPAGVPPAALPAGSTYAPPSGAHHPRALTAPHPAT